MTMPHRRHWLRPEAIESIRDRHAWSQAGLAADLGLDRTTLSRYLHGHRPVGLRSRRRLIAWAEARGIDPGLLLRADPPNPAEDAASA